MAPRRRAARIDPVTVSVLASRLSAIVEEMGFYPVVHAWRERNSELGAYA